MSTQERNDQIQALLDKKAKLTDILDQARKVLVSVGGTGPRKEVALNTYIAAHEERLVVDGDLEYLRTRRTWWQRILFL